MKQQVAMALAVALMLAGPVAPFAQQFGTTAPPSSPANAPTESVPQKELTPQQNPDKAISHPDNNAASVTTYIEGMKKQLDESFKKLQDQQEKLLAHKVDQLNITNVFVTNLVALLTLLLATIAGAGFIIKKLVRENVEADIRKILNQRLEAASHDMNMRLKAASDDMNAQLDDIVRRANISANNIHALYLIKMLNSQSFSWSQTYLKAIDDDQLTLFKVLIETSLDVCIHGLEQCNKDPLKQYIYDEEASLSPCSANTADGNTIAGNVDQDRRQAWLICCHLSNNKAYALSIRKMMGGHFTIEDQNDALSIAIRLERIATLKDPRLSGKWHNFIETAGLSFVAFGNEQQRLHGYNLLRTVMSTGDEIAPDWQNSMRRRHKEKFHLEY